MRIGYNPNKDKEIVKIDYTHQIIIPLYIPNQEGYFKDSLKVFKLCISSLKKTIHSKTFVTVVNNGSCKEVTQYLNSLYTENTIHEVVHTGAIGKLNAIVKGIVGHNIKLVTITDADVLFLNKWQEETENIFNNIKRTGAVSPVPNSKLIKHLTSNVLVSNFFSNKLKFSDVINPDAMKMFEESISNKGLFNAVNLKKYLTVEQNKVKAVVGAGHFVTTYRADVFNKIKKYSNYSLGGDSERVFLDEPVLKQGFWRLSTTKNMAYHMGNTLEEWMTAEVNNIEIEERNQVKEVDLLNPGKSNYIFFKFFSKLLYKKKVWRLFLKYKGLSSAEAKEY